jgi:hypothetical protein
MIGTTTLVRSSMIVIVYVVGLPNIYLTLLTDSLSEFVTARNFQNAKLNECGNSACSGAGLQSCLFTEPLPQVAYIYCYCSFV